MANFSNLPQELIRHILDLASYLKRYSYSSVHKPFLCSFSLVHSSWRVEAQSLMAVKLEFVDSARRPKPSTASPLRHPSFIAHAPSGYASRQIRFFAVAHDDVLAVLDKARVGGIRELDLLDVDKVTPALLAHQSLTGERI